MKARQRKSDRGFSTKELGLDQSLIEILHGRDISADIRGYERRSIKGVTRSLSGQGSGSSSRVATFFTTLHCAPPEITEGGIARCQGVEVVTLCIAQRAIVSQPLDDRFHTVLGVIRRPLRGAIKIDIKLDLQAANIFLKSNKLLLGRRLVLSCSNLGLRSLLRPDYFAI